MQDTKPYQPPIFSENHINNQGGHITIQNAGVTAQKRQVSATSKIDDDLNKWANDIADAVSNATGNAKYGRSTVINEAIKFYRQFYSVSHKMVRDPEKVIRFMEMI